MISKVLQDAINEQINKELYSAYLYLSMAGYFESKGLHGFAKWMQVQEGEERGHAMKFYAMLEERGARPVLKAIAMPPASWGSNMEVIKEVAKHEAGVSASINALYELALKEKDYPMQFGLQWFITEQVEEEKNAADIIQQLEMIEAHDTALLMLDKQLGKRQG